MSNWIRFNHGDCPVCSGLRKDCRQNAETNLVHCRSTDANPPDWIFRGQDACGFAIWVYAPDAEAWTQEKREEWERERKAKRQKRQRQAQEQNERSLSAVERHREIKKVLSQLSLSDRHRQQLKSRGLTDQQIKSGFYRSLGQWQKLDIPVDDRLAGLKFGGRSLVNPDSGILCPIPDAQGQLVSWQLRQDNNFDNKYIWAASERQRKNRPTSKTKEFGELPLGVWQESSNKGSNTNVVGLTEGTGIKPYIASCRLNIPVIGASGGNFASSPKSLRAALEKLKPSSIVFYPDGGAVCNPNIVRQYKKLFDLLLSWGYQPKIAWWGQIQKSDGDVDEIDSATFSKAEYLTPKEFFKLAQKQQYIQGQWDNWRNYKKFTPQLKVEKKFIEFGLPQKDTITFIKSGLGTGKTTEIIRNLIEVQNYGIIGLGYRNTLLLQFNEKAKKLGFYHLQSDKNLREFSLDNPSLRVTNCIDSLVYYVKEQFDGKIIVVDEVISVLKHLLFSSTVKQFSKVKQLFTEMVNRCDRLICLDGFMQDWAVNFFKELCPSKQIITLENVHQGDKAQIYLLEGTINIDEKVIANDRTLWIEKLLNSDCPAICSDSQIFCEAIERLLQEQGRNGVRVDSKTVSEKYVKDFFTEPDKYIRSSRPEYLIYSPSAESGLDVSTLDYFNEHFCFFFGQLDVDSMIQMLGRIRDVNVPKYIWCKKFIAPEDTSRRPSNLESIQADRARSLMSELNLIIENTPNLNKEQISSQIQIIYQNNLDPYATAADSIAAIRNYEFANYRECLKRQLIDSGYFVESVIPERLNQAKAIALQEKEAKTEVKQQNASDIYHASDRYIGQSQVNLSFDASWETRCSVVKAKLVSELPGINRDPVWSPEFIKLLKYDKPNLINQTKLYYLLANPELAKELSLEKYNRIFNRGAIAAPWKLRQDYLKIKTLRDVGLCDFIQTAIDNPDFRYTANCPQVKAIIDKCRRKKNRDVLGTPGSDPIKSINKLLRSVGIETTAKKVKRSGRTISVYAIDQKHLLDQKRLAILRAIKLKYDEKINMNNAPLEWVAHDKNFPQNSPIQKSPLKIAENTDRQSLDAVALSPCFYINNTSICNPYFNHQSLAYLPTQMSNTNQIQNGGFDSDLDSPESTSDLAGMLAQLEDGEQLAELLTVPEFTRIRLNRACRLLPPSQQQLIRGWAIENQRQQSTA
ncbi:MAG TPA: plasmid replication protein, CyRepA1 family [Coleofasciculaceae cyanobacterium]